MTQEERSRFLLQYLLHEKPEFQGTGIPDELPDQKRLLRSLFSIRPPMKASAEFLRVQDAYLRQEILDKGIIDAAELKPIRDNICLLKGDITTLKADAVVNAANNRLLGCFIPCHGCIDNAIHSYAGIQLRLSCNELMLDQKGLEPTGSARLTPAFNLPSKFVLHTVGPVITGAPTAKNCEQLASCYRSCLDLTDRHQLRSIAFCCISTGEFHFPNGKAAEIALDTVTRFIAERNSTVKIIFNVFKDEDYAIYHKLLAANKGVERKNNRR